MTDWKSQAYLASRVHYFGSEFLPLVLDDATERVLNGRIVALHEMAFDELDCER